MSDLNQAPTHVRLAVDLIMLLEQSSICAKDVLDALAIVKRDYQQKIIDEQQSTNSQTTDPQTTDPQTTDPQANT